ncbi:MAG: HK97 gp10 family phage protein, partial [Abditibacteriota bacterium]|nr:HK97 gp10 family phage protein [Abditibacteriota bacterium]
FLAQLDEMEAQVGSMLVECTNTVSEVVNERVKDMTPVAIIMKPDPARYEKDPFYRAAYTEYLKSTEPNFLRKGWHIKPAVMKGRTAEGGVFNNVKYAPYLEYGHRLHAGQYIPLLGKRLKASFVPGFHMLQKAEDKTQRQIRRICDPIVRKYFGEYLE